MSIASNTKSRWAGWLSQWLEARVGAGHQYGRPVEVTVREVLVEAPCFVLIVLVFGAVILL